MEFLRELRLDTSLKGTVVFILTTSGAEADRARAYDENVAGYMVKSAVGPVARQSVENGALVPALIRQVENAAASDVVVTSTAVHQHNAEVVEARARKIPVIQRAEMLAELMRLRYGIAIAGAHGKTTTTSMVALVLERAGLDPTAVIGGRLSAFGSNARLGKGDCMVVEADESDRSFLKLTPSIAVITNIDHEHMESYGSWDALQQAFVDFANKVPFYGTVVACVDDGPVRALVPGMTRRVVTYGFEGSGATVLSMPAPIEDIAGELGLSVDVSVDISDTSGPVIGSSQARPMRGDPGNDGGPQVDALIRRILAQNGA